MQSFSTYFDISHEEKVDRASTCPSAAAQLAKDIWWNLGGFPLRFVTNFKMLVKFKGKTTNQINQIQFNDFNKQCA